MRLGSLKLKRQFARFCLLICTLIGVQAQAIVRIEPLPAESTPLLLKALKDGHDEFYERYKSEADPNTPLSSSFWIPIRKNVEATFKEILKAQLNSYNREAHASLMLSEFQRLQADILNRGYEPSQLEYWALAQSLSLIWNGESFDFHLDLNYQPAEEPLEGGDLYPRVSLKGALNFDCKDPISSSKRFDNCLVVSASLNAVTIEWHSIPSHRGGNSSAGGSTSKQDIMSRPLIVKDLKMAQALGLLAKSQLQQGLLPKTQPQQGVLKKTQNDFGLANAKDLIQKPAPKKKD